MLDIASQTRRGIDLLLADVGLPEMEVTEMQGQIRKFHPTACTLFMSGHPEEAFCRKGIKKEKHNVLFKPCSIRTLVSKKFMKLCLRKPIKPSTDLPKVFRWRQKSGCKAIRLAFAVSLFNVELCQQFVDFFLV